MEGKRAIHIDLELHRKLRILAGRKTLRLYEAAEEAVRRYIGEEWNKKAASCGHR